MLGQEDLRTDIFVEELELVFLNQHLIRTSNDVTGTVINPGAQ